MFKELHFRQEPHITSAFDNEDAMHETFAEIPRVNSGDLLTHDLGIVRILLTYNPDLQQRAIQNFLKLSQTEFGPYLPEFVYPLTDTEKDIHAIVINEFAPDDRSVAVRTQFANTNVYTGSTGILDEAELYFRNHGITDNKGHGTIPDLSTQAQTIVDLLSKHSLSARMSAFSIVVKKTAGDRDPFQAELKLRDLTQLEPQAWKMVGNPIWGADCFWGMIHSALWFHRTNR